MALAAGIAIIAALAPWTAASDFQIQPTSLVLNSGEKSGAFSVINNGNDKMDVQVALKEWTQDANGKDVYADTKEAVFFPKIMTIAAHEQRAVRIGVKAPPSQKEKTFRLFVEEIPTKKGETEVADTGKIRAALTIAFRFTTPIFVMPLKPQENVIIEKIEMAGGVAKSIVRNTGNIHVKLQKVTFIGKAADGSELFTKESPGWYVLHGIALPFEAAVPKDVCANLATILVKVQAENLILNGSLNVQNTMCAP